MWKKLLETCLRSILVPETCRAYLRKLVGQLIPSSLQKLQVQGTGPPVSARRECPFPSTGGQGPSSRSIVRLSRAGSRCASPMVRCPPAVHCKPAAAGGETTVFGQELPPGRVLDRQGGCILLLPCQQWDVVKGRGEGISSSVATSSSITLNNWIKDWMANTIYNTTWYSNQGEISPGLWVTNVTNLI